ncbi:glycosyltransferase [Marilutibacter aestuarii]|uniref:Glycosyltransferase family 1 protein n=1 Tax=Marilutibacter aestuarii TaxID=1706195 RepID=A0A508ANF3_9GAMM|nr:glycosyltransferase [Lysobacter aestuarii]TQD51007.1 glycosyltransferase family 1 protein [Lysobacter aestuarii]
MPPIVLVDPALGRTGAHNRGFAELFASWIQVGGILANVRMEEALRSSLGRQLALVEARFDVDFYALAGKQGGVAHHWDWVFGLSLGYRQALEVALERWPSGPLRILYHTLSWEHAAALSLALHALGPRGDRLQHIALLMYSPGVDCEGRSLDAGKAMNFRLAFDALRGAGDVRLYASCGEYSEAYRHLLGLPSPLDIHPCFLGNWDLPSARVRNARERVILYLGEVKQDKGALELPDRLRRELAASRGKRQFLLQFSSVRTDAARQLLSELHDIARGRDDVRIHEGFWSDEQLVEVLSGSGVLRLDYDAPAYAHKTSGLLWLAAWHRLDVTVPAGSWLEREALRLGMNILPSDAPIGEAGDLARVPRVPNAYFARIFTPFRSWLEALPAPASRGGRASDTSDFPRIDDARDGGMDVVLFWKQNDSTVYGRRNDMVAKYLASRPDVRTVLVVDAPISEARLESFDRVSDPSRHDRLIAERTRAKQESRLDRGKIRHAVFVHEGGEYAFDEQDRPRAAFLDAYEGFLRALFLRSGIDPANSLFWVYPRNFSIEPLIDRFHPRHLVVDVVDDHRAWPGVEPAEKHRLARHYQGLMKRADRVLVNCESVLQAMEELGGTPRLVPNGCDMPLPGGLLAHAPAAGTTGRVLPDFDGQVLGYVGNLESKIDVDLLDRLAHRFPRCRIVLVGSTHANPDVLRLSRHSNIVFPGVVPYDELGPWLARMDLGIIPHLRSELTRHMNPLKAFVYLANGVPVVSTDVPNVEPIPGLLAVASDTQAFLETVEQWLERPRPPRSRFTAVAARVSWEARLGGVVDGLAPSDRRMEEAAR